VEVEGRMRRRLRLEVWLVRGMRRMMGRMMKERRGVRINESLHYIVVNRYDVEL